MVRGSLLVAVAVLTGCAKQEADAPGKCLPVPAATRMALVPTPDGSALYWLEAAREYDFDGDLENNFRLVRFDLRTRQVRVLADHMSGPVQLFQGKVLALRVGESFRAALVSDDGHVRELTPTHLDVLDVEIVDDHTLAVLADGSGARAVYTIDLEDAPRPEHLIDADVLLSAGAGRAIVRVEDDAISIDVKTRKRETFPVRKKSVVIDDTAVLVDRKLVIAQKLRTGDAKTVIVTPRPWKLTYQIDSVLVRTAPKDERSEAWIIGPEMEKKLPTVVGGASIIAAAVAGKRTWALIGHNTANYIADLADVNPEADVCLLPETGDVTFPTRSLPARYAQLNDRLFDAMSAEAPRGSVQIFDGRGNPTTVSIRPKQEGAQDLAAMRTSVRRFHNAITAILGDREVKTEVVFSDARTAMYRWQRDRLRYRASAGMGDAMISDPADYDFEVSKLDNEKADNKITCNGVLRNLTSKRAKVSVKCSGNREHVIDLGELAPDESKPFAQTFTVSDWGEAPYVDAIVDGKLSEPRNFEYEQRMQAVFELAAAVYDTTQLALLDHDVADDAISVSVEAPPSFETLGREAQDTAIMAAYEKYAGLRAIYHVDAKSPLRLKVTVELSEISFRYDGSTLTRDE